MFARSIDTKTSHIPRSDTNVIEYLCLEAKIQLITFEKENFQRDLLRNLLIQKHNSNSNSYFS